MFFFYNSKEGKYQIPKTDNLLVCPDVLEILGLRNIVIRIGAAHNQVRHYCGHWGYSELYCDQNEHCMHRRCALPPSLLNYAKTQNIRGG